MASRLSLILLCLFGLLPAVPLSAAAADEREPLPEVAGFPSQPIRLIVYTSPGGLIDVTARRFAQLAQEHADHPFAVINRPGGGGIVAFEEALREPADGHRFLAVTRSNISKMVATGREDLIDRILWHSYIMDNAHVLITNRDSGLTSWEQLRGHRRADDHDHLWLGVDIGGVKHVSGVRVAEVTGIDMRWIPYGSGGEARAALLGNLGTLYFGNPRDALASPRLNVVAVAAEQRLQAFPDAPTFAELGYPGLEDELIWRGFAFRKGVDEAIQHWYDVLIRNVLADPRWQEPWQGEAVNLRHRGRDEFTRIVERDREEFRNSLQRLQLLQQAGHESGPLGRLVQPPRLFGLVAALVILIALALLGWRRRQPDASVGEPALLLSLLVLGLLAYTMSLQLPAANPIDPIGARGIPQLWLVGFMGLVVLQLAACWRSPQLADGETAAAPRRLPLFIAGYGLGLVLLPVIGHFLVALIYLPAMTWFLGYRRLPVIAGLTIGWLLLSEFVFQGVLHVDLPRGFWS